MPYEYKDNYYIWGKNYIINRTNNMKYKQQYAIVFVYYMHIYMYVNYLFIYTLQLNFEV